MRCRSPRLRGQLRSALGAAAGKDLAAVGGSHSLAEAVYFGSVELLGLIGTNSCHGFYTSCKNMLNSCLRSRSESEKSYACRTYETYYSGFIPRLSILFCVLYNLEKVKQKMPCFFNKLFCVILCILGSTKRPPAKVPPVAYALSCYFRVIFVCYACVFLLNMNEREQHALRRHPLGQRRVRTAPA